MPLPNAKYPCYTVLRMSLSRDHQTIHSSSHRCHLDLLSSISMQLGNSSVVFTNLSTSNRNQGWSVWSLWIPKVCLILNCLTLFSLIWTLLCLQELKMQLLCWFSIYVPSFFHYYETQEFNPIGKNSINILFYWLKNLVPTKI